LGRVDWQPFKIPARSSLVGGAYRQGQEQKDRLKADLQKRKLRGEEQAQRGKHQAQREVGNGRAEPLGARRGDA